MAGPAFDRELAKEAVKKYIDYFCGRCIKSDLSNASVDPWLYNRDAGAGALERIVQKLKKWKVFPLMNYKTWSKKEEYKSGAREPTTKAY